MAEVARSVDLHCRGGIVDHHRASAIAQGALGSHQHLHYTEAVPAIAAGYLAAADAVDEMPAFGIERLSAGETRDTDIAGTELHRGFRVGPGDRGQVDALVVETDLLGRLHVVKDRHLATAHDGELAGL